MLVHLVVGVRLCLRLVVGMHVLVFGFWWARNLPSTGYVKAIGAISGAELLLIRRFVFVGSC